MPRAFPCGRLVPLAVTLSLAVMVSVGAQQQGPAPLSKTDRQRGQLMLKLLKEDIEKNYYDPNFRGIDLGAKHVQAESKMQNAKTLNEVYAILTDFASQFDDSHTVFLPPERRARVEYGWSMQLIGDAPIVTRVTPGSDAAAKGLTCGDRVLAINRFQVDRTNVRQITQYYRIVRPQAMQRLVIRKPDGTEQTLEVASKVVMDNYLDWTDILNDVDEAIESERHLSVAVGKDILVWRMPAFGDPDTAETVLRKIGSYKSLILDLRGNGGGRVDTLGTMVGGFFNREILVVSDKERKRERVHRAKPRRDPFLGDLFVLIDSGSGSAAEIFARVVQIEKRGRVIGDRSAGAVMTARIFPHQLGVDSMTYFATMVTIGDVRMSDGSSLERVGVQPDEVMRPTPADLAARRDPVLARAIGLAGGDVSAEAAGKMFQGRD
jgi:C-terminal processing protease CtpA/Prc